MNKKSKIFGCIVISSLILLSSSVFANPANETLADIVSRITGESVEEIETMKSNGMTYGEIANSFGKLEEFKSETGKDFCIGNRTCENYELYHHGRNHGHRKGYGRHHSTRNKSCLNNKNCPYNK